MSLLSSDFREIAIYMFVFYSTILMYSIWCLVWVCWRLNNEMGHVLFSDESGYTICITIVMMELSWTRSQSCWLRNIGVTNDHRYVPFVVSTIPSSPIDIITGFVARLTYRMWYYWSSFPLIIPPFTLVFSGARIAKMFVLCIIVYRSSLVLWSIFYLYSLYCLSCLDLRLLIVPLVSNFS